MPTYHITEIVPISGYSAAALDVNDNNVVVGTARNGSANPASYGFYWTSGGGAVLDNNAALAVTSNGEVVTQSIDAYSNINSTFLDAALGTLSGIYQSSRSDPYPVFFSHTGAAVNSSIYWSGPTTTTSMLANLSGAMSVVANSINSTGQIVGFANTASGIVPVYWSGPSATPVAMQGVAADPIAISSDGKIIGMKVGATALYYWSSPAAVPVTIALGSDALTPVRINKDGIFVGQAQTSSGGFAMIGTAATGPVDLATRLDSSGIGWILDYAEAINDNGAIVGYGTGPDGKAAAFIAIPN